MHQPASPRVLFVAEMVTLAHLARPLALVQAAVAAGWRSELASSSLARRFLSDSSLPWHELSSVAPEVFARRLAMGQRVYTEAELEAYVEADLALLRSVKPDLVVGDFRLSLSVSARLAGVPYATITNTYWSPYALDQAFPLPVLQWTRWCPLRLARWGFDRVAPLAMAAHCAPVNRVRRRHGLPVLPSDLRFVYTDADHVLCADAPSLFPLRSDVQRHWHLGPVLWSPPVRLPPWWNELPIDRDLVYVTLGSSGDPALLEGLVRALAALDVTVAVATAGAPLPSGLPANVHLAQFLPGIEVARRAALVVCNGGSPTTQQAVDAGVPVLGICGNMDQFLNMRGLEAAGLGVALRADRLSASAARECVRALLGSRQQVARSAVRHREPDAHLRFGAFLKWCEERRARTPATSTEGRNGGGDDGRC